MLRILQILGLSFLLLSCGEAVTSNSTARVLVLGDSMLASNGAQGKAVADVLERELGQEVIDRSIPGARYFYKLPVTGAAGLRIPAQYRAGKWDWVILNGGGNDLLFGCGCGPCGGVLNRLVSPDGRSGTIPAFVNEIRQTGARVIYVGYLRNPGTATPIRGCRPHGDELDRRLTRMASFDSGVTFLPLADLVPHGDWSWHQIDRIHPSEKASAAIAARIAKVIKSAPKPR
ncbi:MAG: SGNH/GDSL hydrolase family protein [Cypionkella sp.]|nr:SGNH/GDSL hydrolase family protein [Cypionkella sp.]